jgi:hypothetical protein
MALNDENGMPQNKAPETKPERKKFFTTLASEEIEVEIEGELVLFKVSELNCTAREKIMNTLKAKSDANGNLKDFTDHKSHLLVACMTNLTTGKAPTLLEIRQWGVKAQDALYEFCQKINGFDKESETEEKKS